MPIIRHGQRPITAVTPTPGQGRWINPNKGINSPSGGGGLKRFYFNSNLTGSGQTASNIVKTGTPYKIIARCQFDSFPALQTLFATNNGQTGLQVTAGGLPRWRVGGTNLNFNSVLSVGTNYRITVEDTAGTGIGVAFEVFDLDTGDIFDADTGNTGIGDTTTSVFLCSTAGGSGWVSGRVWGVEWFEVGIPVFNWPMDEGTAAPEFIESVAGVLNATISYDEVPTGSPAFWVEDFFFDGLGLYLNGFCVGDSFSAQSVSWPKLLTEPDSMDNSAAQGGFNLTQIAASFDGAAAANKGADFVVIQGGVGSIISSLSLLSMQNALESMIDKAWALHLDIMVMNIGPWAGASGSGWDAAKQTQTLDYNIFVNDQVLQRKVTAIDIYTTLEGPVGQAAYAATFLLDPHYERSVPDGLHPGEPGNQLTIAPSAITTTAGTAPTAVVTSVGHLLTNGDTVTLTNHGGSIEFDATAAVVTVNTVDEFEYTMGGAYVQDTPNQLGIWWYVPVGQQAMADITDADIVTARN